MSGMQVNLESAIGIAIHAYGPGEITLVVPASASETVADTSPIQAQSTLKTLTQSIILTPQQFEHWTPTHIDELEAEHFDAVVALEPEVALFGSGDELHFPAAELMAKFYQAGIGIEVMDTAAACRTYNILVSENRNVVAALLMI